MIHVLLALALAATDNSAGSTPSPSPTPEISPAATADAIRDAEYRVGAGDVLDINVIGNAELSRPAAVVQTNGMVTLPLLGEVPVAALTIPEIKTKLTHLLERDYLVRPQVEVKVRDYSSQFVTVLGEVNSPGRKPLRGQTRLYDILTEAGSFTTHASGEVEILRIDGTFSGGEKSLRVRLNSTPTAQDLISFQLPLRHGDLVRALPKYYVIVEGEVTRPGRYVLEPDLTVNGAISMAGGLTRWGKSDLKIIRRSNPTDPTKDAEVIKVDLKGIRKGKKQDVPLMPNDVISVGRRLF